MERSNNAIMSNSTIDNYVVDQIKCESNKWKKSFITFLIYFSFLSEKGLTFTSSSQHIADSHNGFFLGYF